jgi:hypothetical protein
MINYSDENAKILSKNCVHANQMLTLPYISQEKEKKQLQTLLASTTKTHDFAVVGAITPRRSRIIATLRACNLTIQTIENSWGFQRDCRIAECRALLNIHAHENYTVFEALRCNRWLAAGMMVVSESCSDFMIPVANPTCLYIAALDNLVEVCDKFAHNILTQNPSSQVVAGAQFAPLTLVNEWLSRSYERAPRKNPSFVYGTANQFINVTDKSQSAFGRKNGSLQVDADADFNRLFGDICYGTPKELYVFFDDLKISLPEMRTRAYTMTCQDNTVHVSIK